MISVFFKTIGACLALAAAASAASAAESSFQVTAKTPTLTHVSKSLYRSPRMWKKIADWNGILPPYHVRVGQELVIREQPRDLASADGLALPAGALQHVVTSEGPTLGHIAIQVYGRFEFWKRIAEWNHLEPPYLIRKGQKIALLEPPREVRSLASDEKLDPSKHYIVDEEAPSPSEIALRLYGKPSMWREILEWNAISSPRKVRLGQKLQLKKAPTKTREEGNSLLAQMWQRFHDRTDSRRKRDRALAMIAKLGKASPVPAATPAAQAAVQPIQSPQAVEVTEAEAPTTEMEAPAAAALESLAEEATATQEEGVGAPVSRTLFAEGEEAFKAGKYSLALQKFRESREADPETLGTWFYEIRALTMLRKSSDAKVTASKLLDKRPDLNGLPMFQKMFPEGRSPAASGHQDQSR